MNERTMVYRMAETKKVKSAGAGNIHNHRKSPVDRILFLQRTIGNKAVERLMNPGALHIDRHPERKPPGTDVEDDEFAERRPSGKSCPRCRNNAPHNGSATIVCNGSGGYRVSMGWAATATCGIGDCVRRHEESHITDWRRRYPDGCKNADGSNKPDGTRVPTSGSGYDAFLRTSECTAYNVEIPCEEALLSAASTECRPVVQNVLSDSRRQKGVYC